MRKTAVKRLLAVGAAVGVLSPVLVATPAMAGAATSFTWKHVTASYDEDPGDGAESWTWAANDNDQDAVLEVHLVKTGSVVKQKVVVPANSTKVTEFSQYVANMRICLGSLCSDWH